MTDTSHRPDESGHEPPRRKRKRGKQTLHGAELKARAFTPEQRLLILDSWTRSNLPAKDFAPLVGVSTAALYKWRKRFEEHGPAGLEEKVRGIPPGSRLPEPTKRAILLMKQLKPDWGQDRIYAELMRTQGLQASPGAIAKVLEEGGYQVVNEPTRPHPTPAVQRFERAKPNQLWQTDLFTFNLKRQNRKVYLVGFMDDFSRFMVGYGLHGTSSGEPVREVFESAIANHGAPEEVLTDNGAQYHTWRGQSAFNKLCKRRGIKQIVSRPKHPETLGKIERFWKTLWNDCVESAVFRDLDDARQRIGLFIDHYNFHRTHKGIGGLVPADRFFRSAPQVKETLRARVADNAHLLARDGLPRKDFYLTGRVGDVGISLHAEGEQVVLTRDDGQRETVHLGATGRRGEDPGEQALPEPLGPEDVRELEDEHAGDPTVGDEPEDLANTPGCSPLDGALEALRALDAPLPDDPHEADTELELDPFDGNDDGEVA